MLLKRIHFTSFHFNATMDRNYNYQKQNLEQSCQIRIFGKSYFHRKYSKRVLKSGIYHIDCESYPKEQFNPNLKKRYDI